MMGRWLERGTSDISDISAISSGNGPAAEPNGTNVTNVAELPAEVAAGLQRLGQIAAPPLRNPEVWSTVVADAHRLASEGWALAALQLGWTPIDLFGAVTDPEGNPDADGLAVKLAGRKLLAICDRFATLDGGEGGRSYLYRGDTTGAVLLWDIGQPQEQSALTTNNASTPPPRTDLNSEG